MSSIVGAETAAANIGDEIEECVNAAPGELEQEMRLAEPYLWESEFPPESEQKAGRMKEMGSMKSFVYDEAPAAQCSQDQMDALSARGCFQDIAKMDDTTLYGSTPSLVTRRTFLQHHLQEAGEPGCAM